MGLLAKISQLVSRFRGQDARRQETDEFRRCRFESMEPRRLLAADPIRMGATYLEEDSGTDLHGDTFEITFLGGAPSTQLTRVVINGDQGTPGFGTGDVFFDTDEAGLGGDDGVGFQIVSMRTANPLATVTHSVADGSSLLTLDFTGFQAGDKLIFSIDVDEVEEYDPGETSLSRINEGFDPITSGVEFQGSKLTAYFSAGHYYDANGNAEFRNRYDEALSGTGLNLPADDFGAKRDRSAGAAMNLTQVPLPVSISGRVYMEKDLDLAQDAGEQGINNVELALWQKQASSYVNTGFTTKTDAAGNYEFGKNLNLLPGTYQVRESQPSGLFSVGAIPGTVDGVTSGTTVAGNHDLLTEISIPLGDQESIRNDFAEAEPARISGFVYHDRSNDGIRNSGEEGIGGVAIQLIPVDTIAAQNSLTLQANSSGFYEATGLAPGTYRIVESEQPANYFDGIDTPGTVNGSPVGTVTNPGDSLEAVLLTGGQVGINYNFGELAPASIRGRVGLTDADGNCDSTFFRAVTDATVRLLDSNGQLIAETRTNEEGDYEFSGLRPGQYSLVEITPDGLIDGESHPGQVNTTVLGQAGVGTITNIVLGSGQQGTNYDFCEHEPASVSGFVYHDENSSGLLEPGEVSIGNVEISLLDENGNILDSTITDDFGYYEFNGLRKGTYRVIESQPEGWLDGLDSSGEIEGLPVGQAVNPGDQIDGIELRWGESSTNNNFGELLAGSIAGQVHLDLNGDCFLDEGELPFEGVTIDLLDADGKVLATIQTDSEGRYQFNDLLPGTYGVRERQPAGVFHGGQTAGSHGGFDGQDDHITQIEVGSGQVLVEYNFCEMPPATLSGMVFSDPNHDGEFNDGDMELAGVVVQLLNDLDEVIATTSTDASGQYKFENLAPGIYSVRELQPDGYFHGGQTAGSGGGDAFTDDLIAFIFVSAGENYVDYNFYEVPPATLEGTVFSDPNEDCILDTGATPLAGVTVDLLNGFDEVMATQTTNSQGKYRFQNLAPGVYSVRERQPQNYFQGGHSAGSGGGSTDIGDLISGILIEGGENLIQYDFCETPPARITGNVYQDGPAIQGTVEELTPQEIGLIRDGQLTTDDTPLAGVTLQLRDGFTGEAIDASAALSGFYPPGPIQVQTDASGRYEFAGIQGGRSYAVYQVHPDGYVDSIDTVGTTTGFAFNPQSLQQDFFIEPLADQPASDAIIRIGVSPGQSSESNNFSEVKVEPSIIPPPRQPPTLILPPPPSDPPLTTSPIITTQTRVSPPLAVVSWITPRENVMIETMGTVGYSWHLSVVNGGMPRDIASVSETDDAVWRSATYLDQTNWAAERMQEARWVLGANPQVDTRQNSRSLVFGIRGGIPFSGDFNGDGTSEIGVYYRGEWFVDLNGNGVWDEADLWAKLGDEMDRPVVGDWDGDSKDDIGIYGPEWFGDHRQIVKESGLPDSHNLAIVDESIKPKNVPPTKEDATDGQRLLRLNAQGPRRADVIDHVFKYGDMPDSPVSGDWNGDGIRTVGVFRAGEWRIDTNGDGRADHQDKVFRFGDRGDIPIIGDWDGNGVEEIGIYRHGRWILDLNGNRELDAHDKVFEMGGTTDRPVVGDWNGDGVDEPGLYRELPPPDDIPVSN